MLLVVICSVYIYAVLACQQLSHGRDKQNVTQHWTGNGWQVQPIDHSPPPPPSRPPPPPCVMTCNIVSSDWTRQVLTRVSLLSYRHQQHASLLRGSKQGLMAQTMPRPSGLLWLTAK